MRLQGGTFPFGEGPYPSHPSPLATQERTDEEKMDEWAEDQGSQEITDEMNIEHRLEIGQALLYHGLITEQTESKEINEEWVVELTRSFDSMDGASSGAMSKRDAFIFIVGEVKYDEDGFVASIKRMKEANDSRDRLLNGGRL